MSLGKGFSIPQDNRILQNGNFWVPATPEKPVVQRPNYSQAEMQQNQVGAENWQNLLGIYTQFLQDEPSNLSPQKFNANHREPPVQEVAPIGICNSRLSQNFCVEQNHRDLKIRDVTSIGTHSRPPQNFYQTVQNVAPLEKSRSLNPHVGHISSCVPHLGNTIPPRKVNSLADLIGGTESSLYASLTNGEPWRSIDVREKPENILRRSQVESNETAYKSACAIVQPDHILHTRHNLRDYSRQQMPNTSSPASNEKNNPDYIKNKVPGNLLFQEASRLDANFQGRPSVPHYTNYNLNLPPISETKEPSSSSRPFQLAPETPEHQKQPRNYLTIQEPQRNGITNQEKDLHGDGILSQQPEILEINHNEFMQNVLGSSSASILPSPNEKTNFHNVNEGGIDLNKTPQLKPPKRRKHRPKVVKEGKPKKTPKPVVTKNNTPDGTPTGKRKYVRKKGIETLKTPSTDEVKVPDVLSSEKSCRRQLNFDLEKGVEKESQGKEFDYQARDNEQIKVPFNLNLNSHDEPLRLAVKQQTENLFNCVDLVKQNSFQELVATTVPSPTPKVHTLNVIARYLNAQNANVNSGGISQIVIQENSNEPTLEGKRQPKLRTEPQLMETLGNTTEKQGFKRDFSHTELAHPHTITLMGSQLRSNGVFKMDQYPFNNNSNVQQNCSVGVKKSRVGNVSGTSSNMNSGITTVQGYSGTIENRGNKSSHAPSSTVSLKSGLSNSGKEICITTSESNKVALDWYLNAKNLFLKFQQQNASFQVHQRAEKIGQKKSHCLAETQITNSFSTVTNCYQEFVSKRGPKVTQGNELVQSNVRESSTKFSSMDRFPHHETKKSRGSSTKVKGPKEKKKILFSVEDITYGMKELNIGKESGALVPYGGDRAIVAYDPIKRRKPRPKVDLDPETNRLWNLLMGNEGNENTDTDKEKWWEEERKVFRGRIDSFIARMHLVQGDRRFSKWKGSVVDSVIGVFLTQNVSDHLSSSAFMSLAAKFPLKPTQQFCQNKESPSREQHKVRVTYPDGTLTDLMNNPVQKEEDIFSSQSSSESVIFQVSADVRYSSGSNSEAEDQFIGWNFNKNHCTLNLAEQAGRVSSAEQHQFRATGSLFPDNRSYIGNQQLENQVYGQYSYPVTSNVPPVPPSTRSWLNLSMESMFLMDPTRPAEILNKEPSSNGQKYTGKCIDNRVNNAANNLEQCENVNFRPNEMGQVHSSGELSSNIGKMTSNMRKRKAEKEKVEPFNWDTLREPVQMKEGKSGMSLRPMDSLDYETLRNADVREISDTIKERGMNNMLAERMKDFLNRIVQDHGKIDLEWLRDVQSDKVKDYLLSIRGLGLKSVECVRLLTLHHLAFPVDTNVGRIAVRLGWVPLQPLPESLQLHLLEMYPVLESIQKYLWPRLCKLDQETLYELHYQMITFGKVFCTKREPNCNACPMRGECRHFASAFASARLALPGPEEKRIVSSSARMSAKHSPEVIRKHVPLLPHGDNLERQTGFTRNCEPIIEEPTSPEAQTEMLERDIEDAFYEDPDEIPVIKLNIEEFTTNLQNFMQDNLEMQEFDMSKALVALSPEFASIPTPKLKHISRLRTEHQVYELPDLHPLLEVLDRRETDDPSPYLLAIWTPGETADSVQPPESNCRYQEGGGKCNTKTCFSCNTTRETQAQTVRGTILVPCRTAMRGSFPLNGTYFQVNEVFADHESSINPIDVPRNLLWNLPRRTVFFGTSVSTIFKGLSTEDIQYCFWKGFVCVRGFDRVSRAPRPLRARLHFPASKMTKQNEQRKRNAAEQV